MPPIRLLPRFTLDCDTALAGQSEESPTVRRETLRSNLKPSSVAIDGAKSKVNWTNKLTRVTRSE
ncbi:MAG TPA: hypothetical protein VIX42_03330 [Edaphobacter sp.]